MARPTSVNEALHQLDQADLSTPAGVRDAAAAVAYLDDQPSLPDEVRGVLEEAKGELNALMDTPQGIGLIQQAMQGDSESSAMGPHMNPAIAANIERREGEARRSEWRSGSLNPAQQEAWQEMVDGLVAQGIDRAEAEELADLAASQGQFEGIAPPDFIGVPADHVAAPSNQHPNAGRMTAAPGAGMAGFGPSTPRYREGDEWRPAGFSVEKITALQRQLVRAGLLDGDFAWGWFDTPTREAYRGLLGAANLRGLDQGRALGQLIDQRATQVEERRQQAMETFEPEPFLGIDPSSARQQARQFMVANGRRPTDITDEELDEMVAVLTGQYRARHTWEQELSRRQHEAQVNTEFDLQLDPEASPTQVNYEGIGPAPDPEASFFDHVTRHMEPEMRARDQQETTQQTGRSLLSSFSRMGSMIGGGR